jgi:hypothetical protein
MTDLIIRDGTDQNHRFPLPLENGYFNVDEFTFEHLAGMGADLSKCLAYYNFENQIDGNWESLFSSDEAVIFTMILNFDLNHQLKWFTFLSKHREMATLVLQNYRLAERINEWYEMLSKINKDLARDCCRRIRHLIGKKLKQDINRLQAFYTHLSEKNGEIDFTGLNPIWSVDEVHPHHDIEEKGGEDFHFLSTCFYDFHTGILLLKETVAGLLKSSLKNQSHSPASGLYLTFIRLFEKIQEAQNRFTQRHLDFYYDEVLKCRIQVPVSDKAYLCFKKAPRARNVFLTRGTRFSAPTAQNSPRVYLADNDLMVGTARVASLKTLFYERDRLVSPESDMEMITSTKTNQIPVMESMGFKETQDGWPIFGSAANKALLGKQQDATLGFAVAAPVLWLREGRRRVVIRILLARPKDALPEGSLFSSFLEKAATLAQTSPEDIFFKVFPKMFQISLTTTEGWLDIPHYIPAISRVDTSCGSDELSIRFELDPGNPAIEPWVEEIHGKGYDTRFPVIRFSLNHGAYTYPCSILEDYHIRQIEICAQVEGIKNLLLYNNLGRLDPNTPFQPFGPLPAVGSYLLAGSYETAIKKISEFNLDLEWGGLPKGGFKAHYQAYGMGIDNTSFTAGVSVLKEGQWEPFPLDHQPRIGLFNTSPSGDGEIVNRSRLTTNGIDLARVDPGTLPGENFGFDIKTRSGFFKFTITGPEQAFGHREYPFLLTNALVHNAKPSRFIKPNPLPNEPYTPLVNRIGANYTASVRICPGSSTSSTGSQGGALFSLHPFGIRALYPLSKQKKCFIIPDYHKQGHGNLFIGLSSLEPGSQLTLFFRLLEDSRAASTKQMPFVRWFYLSDNRWKGITKNKVVSDTTRGFLSSGIVTLDIPEDMNCDNTVLDEKLYWIRACADKNLTGACSLFSVEAHAVTVTLDDPENQTGNLSPGSITGVLSGLPGISKICQPLPSFDGRVTEKERARKIRISERLKHKNRAVTPWDYEHLILERFPEVFKVKCFPGINSLAWQCWEQRQMCVNMKHWDCTKCKTIHTRNQPGHLLITLVPWIKQISGSFSKDPEPMANVQLLSRVKSYVQGLASTFVSIEVRNPVYEKIQIRCRVRFKSQENLWGKKRNLDQAISAFISPWSDVGYRARFGWCIRRSDLVSHIQAQPYVSFVTKFSMLRIAGNGQDRFELFDTVTQGATRPSEDEKQIHPKYPWSIAVNAVHHFIETTSVVRPIMPEITGIEALEVGNTFIITG